MIVFFTVAFVIGICLIAAFLGRGLMVAGFCLTLMEVFFGLGICKLIPASYSEYKVQKERKDQEEKKAQEQKVNQKK